MTYALDFAPHLGFPDPAQPLFDKLVGSTDPLAHLAFAADNGFARVGDPFSAARDEALQAQIGREARRLGLALGCVVFAPLATARQPLWITTDRTELDCLIDRSLALADRLGTRHIAILTGEDPDRPRAEQLAALTDNLVHAGARAAAEGVVWCIEPVNERRLPGMLLHHLADGVRVVREVNAPQVRLIFDFGHVQAMDGDLLHHMDMAWDHIEIVQVTDNPNRWEPGAGEINVARLLDDLIVRRFSGPCELEHGWSEHTPERQRGYLDWLQRWRIA